MARAAEALVAAVAAARAAAFHPRTAAAIDGAVLAVLSSPSRIDLVDSLAEAAARHALSPAAVMETIADVAAHAIPLAAEVREECRRRSASHDQAGGATATAPSPPARRDHIDAWDAASVIALRSLYAPANVLHEQLSLVPATPAAAALLAAAHRNETVHPAADLDDFSR